MLILRQHLLTTALAFILLFTPTLAFEVKYPRDPPEWACTNKEVKQIEIALTQAKKIAELAVDQMRERNSLARPMTSRFKDWFGRRVADPNGYWKQYKDLDDYDERSLSPAKMALKANLEPTVRLLIDAERWRWNKVHDVGRNISDFELPDRKLEDYQQDRLVRVRCWGKGAPEYKKKCVDR